MLKEELYEIDWRNIIKEILNDLLKKNLQLKVIRRKFYSTVVKMIKDTVKIISRETNLNRVV